MGKQSKQESKNKIVLDDEKCYEEREFWEMEVFLSGGQERFRSLSESLSSLENDDYNIYHIKLSKIKNDIIFLLSGSW